MMETINVQITEERITATFPGGPVYISPAYVLPIATASNLGGVKIGTRLSIDPITGVVSADVQSTMSYPGAGIAVSTGAAWGSSIADNSSNWNTAYGWGNHAGLYSLLAHNHTGTYLPVAGAGDIYTHNASEFLTSVTAHNLLSATHGDTTAAACARGSVIIGDLNSKWVSLAFPGTPTGKVLIATATDVEWSTNALGSNAYTSTAYLPLTGGTLTGHLLFTDNTYDIGASGATRPRTGYFGTSVRSPLFEGGTAAGDYVTYKATTGTGTPTGIAHQWTGGTNGGTVIATMLNNGNVGIGMINPGAKLEVLNSIRASATLYTELYANYDYADLGGVRSNEGNIIRATSVNSGQPRVIFGNGFEPITLLTYGGLFGIGTLTPTASFQVVQPTSGGIGRVFVSTGGTVWTGSNTQFTNTFKVGDTITSSGQTLTILSIISDTSLTTAAVGAAISGQPFTVAGGTRFSVLGNGNVGFGLTAPTAVAHLKAGTATAGTAPTKWTPTGAVLLTTPEEGAWEPVNDDISYTIKTGTARKQIVMTDGSVLTSGKIPIASNNGRLIDVTPQTELTDELANITFSNPGTPDYAIQDLVLGTGYGFVTVDEGQTVLSVIANLQARVNGLETKLVALGLLADAD
jgi:hypothetical protein